MNLKPEPYTIELAEATWIAKALSADYHRPVLTVAALAFYDGAAVLVATDTHRLHVLRLGPVEKEFPTRLVDLRRIIFEARFAKATHIRLDVEDSEVTVGKIAKGGGLADPARIHAPVFDTVTGTYPTFSRVIPTSKRPVAELFAINSKYLADATELTRKNAFRTVILSEGPNKPLVLRSTEDRWLAVVMPMALDGWAAEVNKENEEAVAGR